MRSTRRLEWRGFRRTTAALALGLLFLRALCGAQESDSPAAPTSAAQRTEAVDHALLVGCTLYPRRSARDNLKGCGNDVELMAERFATVLGVAPERTQVLSGWPDNVAHRPTKHNILCALDELAERANPGDRVLIFLAGHGSQQPDGRDRDELDGYDEVFLPADAGGTVKRRGRETIENAITDDELFTALRKLLAAELSVCLFSDSCHSATLARGGEVRVRGIEPEEFGFAAPQVGARGGRSAQRPGDELSSERFVAMYAVQADEQAKEEPVPSSSGEGDAAAESVVHGLFSWSLARALSKTDGDATFDDIYRLVIAGYRELGHLDITPSLQGERKMSVRLGDGELASSLFARRVDDRIEVDGGLLHGLVPGTRLQVSSPDKREVLGELRVVAATTLRAACEVLGDSDALSIDADSRLPVQVLETPAGGRALAVHVVGAAEPTWLASLRAQDPNGARVRIVEAPTDADWILEADGDAWRLQRADEGARARYRVGGGQVATTLLGLHRVANLLRMPARSSAFPDGLSVELLLDGGGPLTDGALLRPGSWVTVKALNDTETPYDLWVFWVDADQGVLRIFPDGAEPAPLLEPARKQRARSTRIRASEVEQFTIDATQGTESFLFFAVPPETSDLSFLETDALALDSRGAAVGEAAEVLSEAAFGPAERERYTKGLGVGFHVKMQSVTTTWEPVRAPRTFEGRALELAKSAGERADAPASERPDPWRLGDAVHVHEREGVRVVADRAEEPRLLLFQFEAPSIVPDDELAHALRRHAWRAQFALAFDPESGLRAAFYDRDFAGGPDEDAPQFELVRVDLDGDALADREYLFRDGAWTERSDPAVPWLRLSELDFALIAPRAADETEEAAYAVVGELCSGER